MNKAIILGNLGQDPETKYLNNGKVVSNFSIATTEKYNGEEKTQWHHCTAWSKTAELADKYLKKGSKVLVEGSIQYGSYENKEGNQVPTTIIVVHKIHFS